MSFLFWGDDWNIDVVVQNEIQHNGLSGEPDLGEMDRERAMKCFSPYDAMGYIIRGGKLFRHSVWCENTNPFDVLDLIVDIALKMEKSRNLAIQTAGGQIANAAHFLLKLYVEDDETGSPAAMVAIQDIWTAVGVLHRSKNVYHRKLAKDLTELLYIGFNLDAWVDVEDEMYREGYWDDGAWYYDDNRRV